MCKTKCYREGGKCTTKITKKGGWNTQKGQESKIKIYELKLVDSLHHIPPWGHSKEQISEIQTRRWIDSTLQYTELMRDANHQVAFVVLLRFISCTGLHKEMQNVCCNTAWVIHTGFFTQMYTKHAVMSSRTSHSKGWPWKGEVRQSNKLQILIHYSPYEAKFR